MAESDFNKNNTEDEAALLKLIDSNLFAQARKWKFFYSGDKHKSWISDIKLYKGMQWGKRSLDKSSISLNRVFSLIQKELPFMTDKKPVIKVIASQPANKVLTDILESMLETIWVKTQMDMKLPECVMNTKQLGTGFLMPFWNPELNNKLGDCDCKVVDPMEIFPLSYSQSFSDMQGVIWARWVNMADIRRDYPKDAERVKPKKDDNSIIPDRAKETNKGSEMIYAQVSDMVTLGNVADRTDYLPTAAGGGLSESDFKRVLLVTAYIKDSTMEEYEDKDKKTGKSEKMKKEKYPYGRQITYASGVLLEDIPYPFKTFPNIIPMINYINPNEFWGMSDITQIKEMQKELNKINALIIDAMKRDVYRQKYILQSSGIDIDTFTNTSDSVYETRVPNPVSETGQFSLPNQVFRFPDYINKAMSDVSGDADYAPPQGGRLPSARAMQQLQEMTFIRLREKIRHMEYSIRLLIKSWVEMIIANYTETRIMRLFNSQNQKEESYVYIFKEEDPQQAQLKEQQAKEEVIEGTEAKDPVTQQPIPGTAKRKYRYVLNLAEINFDLDINIETGSTISSSKVANLEQALSLFDRHVIDQEALLEAADYPNKKEIMQRMQEAAKQQQQAMAQMQQQGATPPQQAQKKPKSPKKTANKMAGGVI